MLKLIFTPPVVRLVTLFVLALALVLSINTTYAQPAPTKAKQSAATRAAAKNAAPLDVAINKAERQVMHSQRAAKLYAQGALGISPARSDIQLGETIAQFESELVWLRANAPNPTILAGINDQAQAWTALKVFLTKPPVKDNIDEVGDTSELLYTKARLTALSMESLTTNPLDEIVGQSARQRVVIQRMGKLFMFERAGFKDAKKKFEIEKAEFLKNHELLTQAKEANADIKRELDMIMGQSKMLFINFVDNKIGGDQNDALVGKSIEVMMKMQETVTTMFERL
jgi:hypothetical protein